MSQNLELRAAQDPAPPSSRHRPYRPWLIALGILLVVVAIVVWRVMTSPVAPTGRAARGDAPTTVGVAQIATGNIDVVLTGLGTVTPLATVTVRTQINGQLQSIGFEEGQIVHRGDFLAQVDPRPYQVALEQARGTLAHDTALLEQAKSDSARYQNLVQLNSIAHQQAADQLFLIKQYQGSVVTDQAAIDSAQLNIDYCRITAPVDGRVGIRTVDPGNYIQTSDTNGIVVLTQLQPISVEFTLPEDQVDPVLQRLASAQLPVTAYDRTDTRVVATGHLATIDSQIDTTTGTIKLRALFPNTDNALFPQQFVNAHLLLQTLTGVVLAPQAAVQTGAPGSFVYLVQPDHTVHVQVVKTGISEGTQVQITSGLQAGDSVVVDGLDRLKDGARIIVSTPGQQGAGQPVGASPSGQRRRHHAAPAPTNAP
jgi:multidrug efflux system membrane fusion protein